MRRAYRALDAVNRLLAPIDALLFQGADNEDPAPLFILGAPRSGTTLAYQLIVQQFRLTYFTAPFGYLYGAPRCLAACVARHTGRPRPVFHSRYGRIPGLLAPSEHANFWFRWLPRDGPDGQYVDPASVSPDSLQELRRVVGGMSRLAGLPMAFKNVYLTMSAGALARAFPRAQFVLIRRDLVRVALSILRVRESRRDPREWWSVRPPGYRDLQRLAPWEQAARQAYCTDSIVAQDLAEYAPNRTTEFCYERLCEDPRAVVETLASRLSVNGYETYEDWRCPEQFSAAGGHGDAELAARLREYIDGLRRADG